MPMTYQIWSDILADLSDGYVYPDITKVLEVTSMINPHFKKQYVTNLEEVRDICREAVSLFEVKEAQQNDLSPSVSNR